MAKQIKTEIIINASVEKVWSVLTKFSDYPNWNPFILSIEGMPIVGQKIKANLQPPGTKAMIFKPRVLTFAINKEFAWLGHFIIPGLFDGQHSFKLIEKGNGSTTFQQTEQFKGILVPLFKKMIEKNTLEGFHQMNQRLKEQAEQTD